MTCLAFLCFDQTQIQPRPTIAIVPVRRTGVHLSHCSLWERIAVEIRERFKIIVVSWLNEAYLLVVCTVSPGLARTVETVCGVLKCDGLGVTPNCGRRKD